MQLIELPVVTNLYSKPDRNGKTKLIKANIITRESYFPFDLDGPYEYYSENGEVYTDVCRVYHRDLGFRTIYFPYEQVRCIIHPQTRIQGFMRLPPEPVIKQKEIKLIKSTKPIKPKKNAKPKQKSKQK